MKRREVDEDVGDDRRMKSEAGETCSGTRGVASVLLLVEVVVVVVEDTALSGM